MIFHYLIVPQMVLFGIMYCIVSVCSGLTLPVSTFWCGLTFGRPKFPKCLIPTSICSMLVSSLWSVGCGRLFLVSYFLIFLAPLYSLRSLHFVFYNFAGSFGPWSCDQCSVLLSFFSRGSVFKQRGASPRLTLWAGAPGSYITLSLSSAPVHTSGLSGCPLSVRPLWVTVLNRSCRRGTLP